MSEDLNYEGTSRERSTFSTFSDTYRGFDAREDDSNGKGLLVTTLAVGVVLVFGTVIWNVYRSVNSTDPENAPVVKASQDPFKTLPDDRQGKETPNQDKRLFDAIDQNDRSANGAGQGDEPVTVSQSTGSSGPKDLRPGQQTQSNPDAAPPQTDQQEAAPRPPVEQPAPPQNVYEEPTLPSVKFDQTGKYLVQVAALRDVGSAELAWSQLSESYPEMFEGSRLDIERADLGASGIFYRVRVSAFSTREDADAFCDELESYGESCMVSVR